MMTGTDPDAVLELDAMFTVVKARANLAASEFRYSRWYEALARTVARRASEDPDFDYPVRRANAGAASRRCA